MPAATTIPFVFQEPDGRWGVYLYCPVPTAAAPLWRRLPMQGSAEALACKAMLDAQMQEVRS